MDLSKKKICVFDTETQNLNLAYNNLPWEIAWAVYDDGKLVKQEEHMLFWPNFQISDGAKFITKFDYNKYNAFAKSPKLVWDKFAPIYFDPNIILLGHNVIGFDIFIMNNLARELFNKTIDYNVIMSRILDTNCLAKMLNKEDNEFKFTDLAEKMIKYTKFFQKGRKTSLGIMAKQYEIEYDENKTHQALYDIELNYKVFIAMLKDFKIIDA